MWEWREDRKSSQATERGQRSTTNSSGQNTQTEVCSGRKDRENSNCTTENSTAGGWFEDKGKHFHYKHLPDELLLCFVQRNVEERVMKTEKKNFLYSSFYYSSPAT